MVCPEVEEFSKDVRNHMSAGMREKAVFVVAREMVGRQGMYSRPASATAGEAERRAYRLLTLAGFTIVLFTSDALAVCAEAMREAAHAMLSAIAPGRPRSANRSCPSLMRRRHCTLIWPAHGSSATGWTTLKSAACWGATPYFV